MKKLLYISLLLLISVGLSAADSTFYDLETMSANTFPATYDNNGFGALQNHEGALVWLSCYGNYSLNLNVAPWSNWAFTNNIDLGDEFTVQFCSYTTNYNESKTIFSNYDGSTGFKIAINTGLGLDVTTNNNTTEAVTSTNNSIITLNTFNTIKLYVRKGVGAIVSIYVNDQLINLSGSFKSDFRTNGIFYLGAENSFGDNRADGYFDALKIVTYDEPTPITPATTKIQAEDYTDSYLVQTLISGTDTFVGNWQQNSWIEFSNIYLNGEDSIKMRIACHPDSIGEIELRLGSPTGSLLSTLDITSTGGSNTFVEHTFSVSDTSTPTPTLGYPYGITPTNVTVASAFASYQDFLDNHLEDCGDGGARLRFGRTINPDEDPNRTASETHAYGMTWSPYFDDQETFDKLFIYYDNWKTSRGLMAWLIYRCDSVVAGQNLNATDADIDAAFGCIVADKKWGSDGPINYRQEALEIIANLKLHCIETSPLTYALKPGSIWGGSVEPSSILNPSYYSPAYFRIFGLYSNDVAFWEEVIDVGYEIIERNLAFTAAVGSLVSDWCEFDGSCVDSVDGSTDRPCHYRAESMRMPWRHIMFYMWYGDSRAKAFLDGCNSFIDSQGGIEEIRHSYYTDGTVDEIWHSRSAVELFAMAGLALEPSDQAKCDNYFAEFPPILKWGHFDWIFDVYAYLVGSGLMQNPLQDVTYGNNTSGTYDLYFKTNGVAPSIDWFQFFDTIPYVPPTPTPQVKKQYRPASGGRFVGNYKLIDLP